MIIGLTLFEWYAPRHFGLPGLYFVGIRQGWVVLISAWRVRLKLFSNAGHTSYSTIVDYGAVFVLRIAGMSFG